MKFDRKWLYIMILSIVSIAVGSFDGITLSLNQDTVNILILSRIPRLLSIILASSALSLAGMMMQQVIQSRYVSPSTSGTVEFARAGILVGVLFFNGSGVLVKTVIAFIFSLVGTLLFVWMIRNIKAKNSQSVAILGMILSMLVGSTTMIFAYSMDMAQNVESWVQGSFSLIGQGNYELLWMIVPVIAIAYLFARQMMVSSLGEDMASNLGVHVKRVQLIALVMVSLLSSLVVINVGLLPFVGLVIPNIVTLNRGDYFKENMGHCMRLGIVSVLLADIIARIIIFPYEMPVSIVLAIGGSIIFLWLILTRRDYAY